MVWSEIHWGPSYKPLYLSRNSNFARGSVTASTCKSQMAGIDLPRCVVNNPPPPKEKKIWLKKRGYHSLCFKFIINHVYGISHTPTHPHTRIHTYTHTYAHTRTHPHHKFSKQSKEISAQHKQKNKFLNMTKIKKKITTKMVPLINYKFNQSKL